MSIIHSALRKVQNKRFKLWEKKEIEDPFKDLNFALESLQTKAIEKYHTQKRRSRFLETVINIVGLSAVLIGIYYFVQSPFGQNLRIYLPSAAVSSQGEVSMSAEETPVQNDRVVRNMRTIFNQDISYILPFAEVFPEKMGELICTGIIYDRFDPACIVNGNIMKTGDRINGSLIIHIDPEVVIFLKERRLFSLTVI